ncbi:hypothetical protein [Hyalangium minutum]|uniref:Uncharacterized protein n=1 Tax=Hyalangium minutum TaxID=394096 RepID=A0A085WLV2_9BACT|nr:hypothetical protein [Hyalangium minutum]KFE68665.1 hypothetical protein DB31_7902 [Hyalangium minutum]
MAQKETKQPGPQPAEDMFGRPTSPRHEEPAQRPTHDAPGGSPHHSRKSTEEEEEHPDIGGVDDIPDGDGPRSDRGNNPLPEGYWAQFPGDKP